MPVYQIQLSYLHLFYTKYIHQNHTLLKKKNPQASIMGNLQCLFIFINTDAITMTHFIWINGGFGATLLDEFKHFLPGRLESTICSTQEDYRPQRVMQQLHTISRQRQGEHQFISPFRGMYNCFFFTWMCFARNSRKVPFSKDRKSLAWKCLSNFFSNAAMCAKVKVEFWDDKLSLMNCFNLAERQSRSWAWRGH